MTRVAFGKVADKLRARLGYGFPRLGPLAFSLFFKLMPRCLECEIVPGIRLPLDFSDGIIRATYWRGRRFERPSPQRLAAWVRTNGVFFDIGANYGFYSYCMLSQHPDVQVYAFEPNPATYQQLVRAKKINRLQRLSPIQLGLSDKAGSLKLHVSSSDSS
ncbi:MAG: FkbM family methyltransferase, partial [Lentisphaerales bacterium]